MNRTLLEFLHDLLSSTGLDTGAVNILSQIITVVLFALAAWVLWFITRIILRKVIGRLVTKSRTTWDDEAYKGGVFNRLTLLVPALFVYVISPTALAELPAVSPVIRKIAEFFILLAITLTIVAFLNFLNTMYNRRPDANRRPIKGIIQAVQVVVIVAAVIFGIALLTGKPISGLLGGLGALSAVLLIVFREPLTGLVSGFQISANDLVRIGDWIEVPAYGADGDVIDIGLVNVTVRNWDKTYAVLPIQALTTGSFRNWRGMQDAGGRRIKRSIPVDMTSVRFLTDGEIAKLEEISLLSDYLEERRLEIAEWNNKNEVDVSNPVNGRRMTNLGTFRAYVRAYIRAHPGVRDEMTLLVRQLPPGPDGLPLEIYLFSKDINWTRYEDLQSDLFDHFLASLTRFGLEVFQNPTGRDLRMAAKKLGKEEV